MSSISVILPTYNERDNLPILVWMLVKVLKGEQALKRITSWDIVIVDDASPDGTGEVANKLQSIYSPTHIILAPRPGKLGLGSAYVHGLEFAKGEWIVIMDSDMSHHPSAIPLMLEQQRLHDADIVKGNRYIRGGGVYGWSLFRKLASRGMGLVAEVVMGSAFTDLTGSYRLYRRDVLRELVSCTVTKGYTFQLEMMVRAEALNLKIAQVPIEFVDRQYGESKMGAGEMAGFLKGLWALLWTDLTGTKKQAFSSIAT